MFSMLLCFAWFRSNSQLFHGNQQRQQVERVVAPKWVGTEFTFKQNATHGICACDYALLYITRAAELYAQACGGDARLA